MERAFSIADDWFVIPANLAVPTVGFLPMNTMVLRGREPMIIDTNCPVFRNEYLDAVFSIVEPRDVRWIFLSHDDRDHSGNLMQVLERCPNAKLVTNFAGVGRLSDEMTVPMPRVHFLNNDETIHIGDRTLKAVRVPLVDAPSTRGLWDPKSSVLYTADAFGATVPAHVQDMGDLSLADFEQGFNWFNRINFQLHDLLDPAKVDAVIGRLRALRPKVLVSYHGPIAVDRATQLFAMLSKIPMMEPLQQPNQADLEAMLRSMAPPGQPRAARA
jgi:flavorubredoxin